jgi:DNA-binding IscR family transcriptional regulator
MIVPKTVETCLRAIDILRRADCEWCPSAGINRHMTDVSRDMLNTMLYRMTKAGFLEAKRGPTGGYKIVTDISLYDIYKINVPSCIRLTESCLDEMRVAQAQIVRILKETVIAKV